VELEFWRSIKDSNKPEELNAYLSNYPNGQFRSLALSRIASLESGPKPDATRNLTTGVDPATFKEEADQTTEDQIGLDKGQRRDVQRRLTGLGFDTKATGQFDQATRGVIARWQAARGYPKSGYLNKLQHKALLTEIVAAPPTASSDEERPKRRATSSGQAQSQPQQAPPQRQQNNSGPDPAGAGRFIGGVVGGMLR
jgi:peptidoglycan hydrolase-like protein with peptidoglycan-binding domain